MGNPRGNIVIVTTPIHSNPMMGKQNSPCGGCDPITSQAAGVFLSATMRQVGQPVTAAISTAMMTKIAHHAKTAI
jgi:hypothetical protein